MLIQQRETRKATNQGQSRLSKPSAIVTKSQEFLFTAGMPSLPKPYVMILG